ncbi:MAG: patatin-like phospholipase family protein [Elusimicrobia bacterium]|nr:patatin-like phospholipase family protein [Elusimicrobiota bacterium]
MNLARAAAAAVLAALIAVSPVPASANRILGRTGAPTPAQGLPAPYFAALDSLSDFFAAPSPNITTLGPLLAYANPARLEAEGGRISVTLHTELRNAAADVLEARKREIGAPSAATATKLAALNHPSLLPLLEQDRQAEVLEEYARIAEDRRERFSAELSGAQDAWTLFTGSRASGFVAESLEAAAAPTPWARGSGAPRALSPASRDGFAAEYARTTVPAPAAAEESASGILFTPETKDGIALALSGGGYRATLFHVGSLVRLNEAGLLPKLSAVSAVSGGAITMGVLALAWKDLIFDDRGVAINFQDKVVRPLLDFTAKTIDVPAIALSGFNYLGIVSPALSANAWIVRSYRKHLFGKQTLQDLPSDGPRFIFNAANWNTGVLWRFTRDYAGDYKVGKIVRPKIGIAEAVAASSAFPPFLSPAIFSFKDGDFVPGSGLRSLTPALTRKVTLLDGGVYENLGVEAVREYSTLLISDAGASIKDRPGRSWLKLKELRRVLSIDNSQVNSLRKRQMVGEFMKRSRGGAYWGIGTQLAGTRLEDPLDFPIEASLEAANARTRLNRFDPRLQAIIVDWAYAVADSALRRFVDRGLPRPRAFPLSPPPAKPGRLREWLRAARAPGA